MTIFATDSVPFTATLIGGIILLLLGGLISFLFAYVPTKFKQSRDELLKQTVILTELQISVSPQGRKGLVERVETLEANLSVLARELENYNSANPEIIRELKGQIETVKVELGTFIRRRGPDRMRSV